MSKYRVELKPSRLQLVFQLLTFGLLAGSIFSWQSNVIPNQILLQIVVVSIIAILLFKKMYRDWHYIHPPVVFSVKGDWLESDQTGQVAWKITKRSRASSTLLFIHLSSPLSTVGSKWCLIFSDQVKIHDFRRLSRAILFQQQLVDNH